MRGRGDCSNIASLLSISSITQASRSLFEEKVNHLSNKVRSAHFVEADQALWINANNFAHRSCGHMKTLDGAVTAPQKALKGFPEIPFQLRRLAKDTASLG